LSITPVGQRLLDRSGFTEIISLEDGQRKGYVLEDVSKSTALLSKVLAEAALQTLPLNGNTRQQG